MDETTQKQNKTTRDKILDVSVKLFNENMATNVSTVQIADTLSISTGNLYYHFRNKEHIIREIYETRIMVILDNVASDQRLRFSESGLIEYFTTVGRCIYRYRFFFYELYTLLANDPELKALYRTRSERVASEFEAMFKTAIAVGMMKPIDDDTIRFLREIAWMITQIWAPMKNIFYEELNPKDVAFESIKMVYEFLKPYFTDVSIERMDILINMIECETI